MQGSLGASREQVSWVITSYVVAAAIFTPPAAFLASRFGRKNMFLVAVTLFTVASVLCGFAQSLSQLVFFRIVQIRVEAGRFPYYQVYFYHPSNLIGEIVR